MVQVLHKLSDHCRIGIVTGSDFSYVKEQIGDLFKEDNITLANSTQLFPCNGTQAWHYNGKDFVHHFSTSLIDKIGAKKLHELCRFLLQQQLLYMSDFPEVPATGDFIVNRGSMLNYCPPGRSCSPEQRKKFKDIDVKRKIRMGMFRRLNTFMEYKDSGCVAALGGNTSIDIYPRGWDKTYVLNHYHDNPQLKASFIGDRCQAGGNDKTIYEEMINRDNSIAFETTSPEHTIKIIQEQLIPYFLES